ncbi:5-formyltetrahydrofolate cyclo-ligase [Enterococcus sp. JM4C]|uniref:5-formyltetrahydrofolate cyclo-ligase n=1 Tax=Candidatus Enterococcus huntleyi TaxID=1857217 RepID=UPI00137A6A6B|nr:5-formyltetrahydrofolate cyclo-ligase [Enterococcus sp. JM4C]KAF1296793.1 5-formyltetrahydrofolate cyclo-ligase [Enterococcus sp. JM4C]
MDKKAHKKVLRGKTIQLLQELHQFPEAKREREQAILAQLFASELWQQAQSVAAVISLGFEFETSAIFAQGWLEGKRMAAPKSFPKGEMIFYETTPQTTYTRSSFGVQEPASELIVPSDELSLIIVPGLVFSPDGYRIGFGGGYYDRYLATYTGQTCSLVFREQLQENWPVESFDIPVGQLFTDFDKGVNR